MRLLFVILHKIFRSKCKKHLVWRGNSLVCRRCGSLVAVRYLFDEQVKVLIFEPFTELREEISSRSDTYKIYSAADVVGEVSFQEWSEFRMQMLQDIEADKLKAVNEIRTCVSDYEDIEEEFSVIQD